MDVAGATLAVTFAVRGQGEPLANLHTGGHMPPRPRSVDAEPMAQTTVRFPRTLLKRARVRAANDEITLQALLMGALETELCRREKAEARRQARRSDRLAAGH